MAPRLPDNIKGIRGALEVYGKLLEAGMDVYVPITYIKHDCVAITPDKRHVDIEIESIEPGETAFVVGRFRPRADLFFVLHYEGTNDSWVLPSEVAHRHMAGSGDRIDLDDRMKPDLNLYHDGYRLILGAPGKVRKEAKPPSSRTEEKYFKTIRLSTPSSQNPITSQGADADD